MESQRSSASLYASLLAEDVKKSPVYAVNTLYSLWSDALGEGGALRRSQGGLPRPRAVRHVHDEFGPETEGSGDAIEQVAAAVRLLEGSPHSSRVMPEVSVNIAYAPEGARSVRTSSPSPAG